MKALILLFLSLNIYAIETDQYEASVNDLKESSVFINSYFYQQFNKSIEWANKKNISKCTDVADKVFTELKGPLEVSRLSRYAKHTPGIDRFPSDEVSDIEYLKNSIYRQIYLVYAVVDISRTINLNGVYLGTDKLGHMTLVGRNYYRRYVELIEKGMKKNDAINDVLARGIRDEINILGYKLSGVLSSADLEANYQGLRFGIDMCEGKNPYLIQENNEWKMNDKNVFDVKKYITVKMNEAYNRPLWTNWLYNLIKNDIRLHYCAVKDRKEFKDLMASYERINIKNVNDEIFDKFIEKNPAYNKQKQDINLLCIK